MRDHPPGLRYLFFAEMWERFSYYGMRSLLVFYITSEFLYSQDKAYGIYGVYTALVYTTPIIGGLIADRIIGDRKAIIIGGILIALGHISLVFAGEMMFFVGLSFIISGTGLFKANMSALLGKLYQHGDPRRDAGFTLFYVGINIGSFLAPLTCGVIGETYGWHYGFSLAAFGMLLGLVVFFRGMHSLEGHGLPPKNSIYDRPALWGITWEQVIYVLCFLTIPLLALVVKHHDSFAYILPVVGIGVVGYMLYLSFSMEGEERRNILTILVLMFFFMTFFALFEQAGSSINFFTKLQVDRSLFGWDLPYFGKEIPASAFQSLNPLFVIFFGPIVAQIWMSLAARNREPYTPFKFFLGLFPAALGFAVLAISTHYGNSAGLISMWWIVLVYWLHTIGEVCISPVALSMVTKLAPHV
jgi:POT family proton-dependent oligopeptide transporter